MEEELGRLGPGEQARDLQEPVGAPALQVQVALGLGRAVRVVEVPAEREEARLGPEVAPEVRGTMATVLVTGTAMAADMVMDMVRDRLV